MVQPARYVTPEEYLERERRAETKSEYFDGQVFALAGASANHNRIVVNLIALLRLQLRNKPCEPFASDMRVKVEATGLYTYPDVVVVCGEPQFEDEHRDTLLNPVVIIEVLSPSTEAYDRGKKFAHYRRIPSLQEYLLVAQDGMRVERFQRQEKDRWILTEYAQPEEVVVLDAIGCTLRVEEIYERVEWETAGG